MPENQNENPLHGTDRPRNLPAELRVRLESELRDTVLLTEVDRARPIPPAARARIEAAVLARIPVVSTGRRLRGWIPAGVSRPTGRAQKWMPLVAAVAVLVLATTSAIRLSSDRNADGPGSDALTQFELEQGTGAREGTSEGGGSGPAPPFSDQLRADGQVGVSGGGTSAASPGAMSDFDGGATDSATPSSEAFAGQPSGDRTIRIGLSGPDNDVASGFRAYLQQLNAQGGIGGSRRVEAVNPSTPGLLATASTSLAGPLDPRSPGPRLDGPAASEGALRSDTFSFASAPERLGNLLADALYPQARAGASVVIFTGAGVFDRVVPDAVASALREKGIVASRVSTRSGRPVQWPDAEVAVLSLSREEARVWIDAAGEQGYTNPRGVAGVWSLAEAALVGSLPEGSTVISPYAAPRAAEAEAMRAGAGGPPSFGFVHGWATAKALSIALHRSGAGAPEELAAALADFPADDLGGLIAPYRVRSGTNSRTPEGVVSEVRGGSFRSVGGFRADPRT